MNRKTAIKEKGDDGHKGMIAEGEGIKKTEPKFDFDSVADY